MSDFGEEDILDAENPFNDLHPGDLQFDFVNNDVLVSADYDPTPNPTTDEDWLGEIENFLLSDSDYLFNPNQTAPDAETAVDAFLSDIIVDSPSPPADLGSGSSSSSGASHDHPLSQLPSALSDETNKTDDDNDPVDKKRKRQVRNRDAAVRSRERKKMYVKDLEMKSRYYEAECRRLGMMLQCCLAENQALRFSLHTKGDQAFAASATKQESAVLLLESLLLGSLLWLLGIMGLLILNPLLLLILNAAAPQKDVGGKGLKSPTPRREPNNMFGDSTYQLCMMSKRWRGSRTRMKVLYEWYGKVGFADEELVSRLIDSGSS